MRLVTYLIIFVSMMVMLEFLGIAGGEFNSTLSYLGLNLGDNLSGTGDFANSGAWLYILVILGGATAVSVAIGFLTKTFSIELVLLPIVTFIFVRFVNVGWTVIGFAADNGQNWLVGITILIFSALSIGFMFTAVDWVRGFS